MTAAEPSCARLRPTCGPGSTPSRWSKDDTVPVLQSFGTRPELKWWSEPDHGVVDAVNKGLARATGDIIGIQSSDDLYLPGALSIAAAELLEDPELVLVYGDVEYIDA